jgi:uncharacterized protein YndB with AHSA1/START domain
VPTTRASRTISAPVEDLWELVCDPHHLPRWWPRVTRVEGVADGSFTQVMKTKKGKVVRADFDVHRDDAAHTVTWVQRIPGTPFASVLRSAETELRLAPTGAPASVQAADAWGQDLPAMSAGGRETEVTIELRQEIGRHRSADSVYAGSMYMRAVPRFGAPLVRRAAAATLAQALDGLERISG